MKKLIYLFTGVAIICFSLIQTCYAESVLTFFDTVVIKEQREISRDEVINQVNKQAKNKFSDNATSSNIISDFTKPSLKTIMNSAANTFFQK